MNMRCDINNLLDADMLDNNISMGIGPNKHIELKISTLGVHALSEM